MPNASTCTEWSITSSAGTSGLIFAASPPIRAIASRIAARSTTAGTPVKSCISTRAGVNAISLLGCAFASQLASASTSAAIDRAVALRAQQVLEQDLQRERQPRDVEPRLQGIEADRSRRCAHRPRGWRAHQSCCPTCVSRVVSTGVSRSLAAHCTQQLRHPPCAVSPRSSLTAPSCGCAPDRRL